MIDIEKIKLIAREYNTITNRHAEAYKKKTKREFASIIENEDFDSFGELLMQGMADLEKP